MSREVIDGPVPHFPYSMQRIAGAIVTNLVAYSMAQSEERQQETVSHTEPYRLVSLVETDSKIGYALALASSYDLDSSRHIDAKALFITVDRDHRHVIGEPQLLHINLPDHPTRAQKAVESSRIVDEFDRDDLEKICVLLRKARQIYSGLLPLELSMDCRVRYALQEEYLGQLALLFPSNRPPDDTAH